MNSHKEPRDFSCFVKPHEAGVSLIDFLSRRFPYHAREIWLQKIHSEQVLVEDKISDSEAFLRSGVRITYRPPLSTVKEPFVNTNYEILKETNQLLFVNKPYNLPMHPAGRYRDHTLAHLIRTQTPWQEASPIHRIDRETSGVVLFNKKKETFALYQQLFEARRVQKVYICLVYGFFPEIKRAKGFLEKDTTSKVRKKMKYLENSSVGLSCETELKRLDYDSKKGISIVMCKPITGRIHQIRATLLGLGFPVVGDKLYGREENCFLEFANTGNVSNAIETLGHYRQALHALSLSFLDPISGIQEEAMAPLPPDITEIMSLSTRDWSSFPQLL